MQCGSVPKTRNEKWEQYEEAVKSKFKEKLDLDNFTIDQARYVNKKRNRKSQKPGTIVCKLRCYKHKKALNKASRLKGNNIFVNEDFSFEKMWYKN